MVSTSTRGERMGMIELGLLNECKKRLLNAKTDILNRVKDTRKDLHFEDKGGDEADQTVRVLAEAETLSLHDRLRSQLLEIEMTEHRKADHDYQTTVATVVSVARRAKPLFENSSDIAGNRAFLNLLLQNPTVNGKKLAFTLASPFNLVL